jgi:hypothetical protein
MKGQHLMQQFTHRRLRLQCFGPGQAFTRNQPGAHATMDRPSILRSVFCHCVLVLCMVLPMSAPAAEPAPAVATDLESIKLDVAKLKRDLVILEEELLFPASSQVSVFLAMDVGEFFNLDAVTIELNGKEIAHHLYTEKQADALLRGGVHKVWLGNVKQGENQLTAFFVGRGPEGREYKRATSVAFEKGFEPTFIELAINDSQARYQPDFRATVVE